MEERTGLLHMGEQAPGFSATLSTGETITLEQFRGKQNVVLFFYPKDKSMGCTAQVCSYRDNYEEVRRLGALMIGVSHDGSASHERFITRQHLPFPLICDTGKSLTRLYGVARLGGLFPPVKRVTYVIDRDGIIRGVIHHEVWIGRNIKEILEMLKSL